MSRIFFLLPLIFSAFTSLAQDVQWVSQLTGLSEEVATDVVVDNQGNRYICGFFGNTMDVASGTLTSQGFRDAFLAKYNASGQEVWHLQLGSLFDDEGKKLGIDAQGRLFLLINHNDTLSIQGQTLFSNSYWSVLVFDSDGNLLQQFDPFVQVPTFFTLTDMAVSQSGKIMLTGDFGLANFGSPTQIQIGANTLFTYQNSNGQFARQVWIASYESSGQVLWAMATRATGFSGATAGRIEPHTDGSILISGTFSPDVQQPSDMDFGPSTDTLETGDGISLFVARFDSLGTFQWADAIGSQTSMPGFPVDVESKVLHGGADGSVLVGGKYVGNMVFGGDSISTPSGGFLPVSHLFVARYTPDLQQSWVLGFPGTQFSSGELSAIASDANGNVYLGGTIRDSLTINGQILTGTLDIFLAKLDSTGQTHWIQTAQGDDSQGLEMEVLGLHSTSEGALSICGSVDAPATFGGITLTEPGGTSCCSNAYLALIADSCTAFQPQASFGFVPDTDPQTILFTSSASPTDSVVWDFGEGRSSDQLNPSHRFFVPGAYEVCQTVSNACGSDTFCQMVYVNCAVTASFGHAPDSTNLVVSFFDQSSNADQWIWDFGDGNGDTLSNPIPSIRHSRYLYS